MVRATSEIKKFGYQKNDPINFLHFKNNQKIIFDEFVHSELRRYKNSVNTPFKNTSKLTKLDKESYITYQKNILRKINTNPLINKQITDTLSFILNY